MSSSLSASLYVGLMSGTSMDGVDAVLASFGEGEVRYIESAFLDFPPALREQLMQLQAASDNEIQLEGQAANGLARVYAECVASLLAKADVARSAIRAVAVHGQTIRHRPELGFTRQTNNPALLAELCGIDVIADFRSRDVAAGGQGAPLVPAFHAAVFGSADQTRVVANIGGIANISVLPAGRPQDVTGFDTGPGNVLMDAWINDHHGHHYDADGAWAASGKVDGSLLKALRADPYLSLPPPKSTGRDLFHRLWLNGILANFSALEPVDVQATLTEFTATTLADAIAGHAREASAVYLCGGGAFNSDLRRRLQSALRAHDLKPELHTTAELGVSPNHVEAMAFAWLGYRFIERKPGNLPAVTGAHGPRILGALYPA